MKGKQLTTRQLIGNFLKEHSVTWGDDNRLYRYIEKHWNRIPSKTVIYYTLQCMREDGSIFARKYYNPRTERQVYVYSNHINSQHKEQAIQLLRLWVPRWPLYSQMRLVYKWGGTWLIANVWEISKRWS